MTSFSQRIYNKYGAESYDDIKNLYNWIEKSLINVFGETYEKLFDIQYKLGEITCVSDSIDDFIKNAYGAKNVTCISLSYSVYVSINDKSISQCRISYFNDVGVNTNDRLLLEKIVDSLNLTSLSENDENNTVTNNYYNAPVINSHDDSEITINDSIVGNNETAIIANDSIIGDNNTINTTKKRGIKQFFINVLQNIVSNGIWYLLSAIIGALIVIWIKK